MLIRYAICLLEGKLRQQTESNSLIDTPTLGQGTLIFWIPRAANLLKILQKCMRKASSSVIDATPKPKDKTFLDRICYFKRGDRRSDQLCSNERETQRNRNDTLSTGGLPMKTAAVLPKFKSNQNSNRTTISSFSINHYTSCCTLPRPFKARSRTKVIRQAHKTNPKNPKIFSNSAAIPTCGALLPKASALKKAQVSTSRALGA